ncbi:MAG: phenylacetate-CoA oxygenase subunit PaaC [Bacteroidetes bacterium]|nr:phenylacetate-CoA oxygenase subunit PaaC [Bacteroidota bacterium]MBS1973044.1 phenylacetate-CoA oxygenase subunit PaaC [Bacteroidota bacterium]
MTSPLINYTLHLADNALILGHRNSEWTGHGPVLEQDIAISNIALDLIGQARNFYQYAAQLINRSTNQPNTATEDTVAYLRDAHDFKNCLLVEQTNGDWAKTILKQFYFSAYQFYLFQRLRDSKDETLAAIAEKSLKEVTYHLRWSSEWAIRLGDGTEESHARMTNAVDDLWMFAGEMFVAADYEIACANKGEAVDVVLLKSDWLQKVKAIFNEATLPVPQHSWMQSGGKEGRHTEHLGYILAEMQFMQRAYPGSTW